MLKLISINIERKLHLDKITTFLKKENPDIVTFQEIFEDDFESFKKEFSMDGFFAPMVTFLDGPYARNIQGVAILSRRTITKTHIDYYDGTPELLPVFKKSEDLSKKPHAGNSVVAGIEIENEGIPYRVFTTHMPVTFEGGVTEFQTDAVDKIIAFLKKFDNFMFCGDLNAPRGRASFDRFAELYTDAIPKEYTNSLDEKIHRVKDIHLKQFMVDGLFLNGYKAHNVRLQDGVSDHMAIVADIERV
jgi:exonuclease III